MKLTAFIAPRVIPQWLRMPQGHAGASGTSVRFKKWVIVDLDSVGMYSDVPIVFERTPSLHVRTIEAFVGRLALGKNTIAVSSISSTGLGLDPGEGLILEP